MVLLKAAKRCPGALSLRAANSQPWDARCPWFRSGGALVLIHWWMEQSRKERLLCVVTAVCTVLSTGDSAVHKTDKNPHLF